MNNHKYLKIKEGIILPHYLTDYGYGAGDVVEAVKYLSDTVLCKLGGYTLKHELTVYIPYEMLQKMDQGRIGHYAEHNGFPKLYHIEFYPESAYGSVKGQKQAISQYKIVDFADAKLPEGEKPVERVSEKHKIYLVIKLGNLYIDELEYSIEKSMDHYKEHGQVIEQQISVSTEIDDAVRFRLQDLRLVKDFASEIGGTVEAVRTTVILERGSIVDLQKTI